MNNMKLGFKLRAAFLGAVLLMGGLAVYMILTLRQVRFFNQHSLTTLVTVQGATKNVQEIYNHLYRLKNEETVGAVVVHQNKIADNFTELSEKLTFLKTRSEVPVYNLTLVLDMNQELQNIIESVNDLYIQEKIPLSEQTVKSELTKKTSQSTLFKKVDELSDRMVNGLNYIESDVRKQVDKNEAQAKTTEKISFTMIWFFSVFVFVVGFLLAKMISKPIEELTSLTIKAGQGDLNLQVKTNSNDEVGQLGKAFNQMVFQLRHAHEVLEQKVKERTEELDLVKIDLEKQQLALMNVLEDVSAQKIYKESESKSLLQTLNEGVLITDVSGVITYANPAFEKMTGFSSDEIKSKSFADITQAFDFNDKPLNKDILQDKAAILAENQGMKLQILKKDGTKLPIIRGASAIYVENEYKGVIRLIHDYSEDLALQRQKDDFFSIASHELRTPLTVISGNLDNVLQGYGGSKFTDIDKVTLTDVVKASDRLIDMVEDFLNVSRLDQGRIKMDIKEVDNCKLLSEVVLEMKNLAATKGVALESLPHTKDHGFILADIDKLREVYINLIGNALKFTKKGSITISHDAEGGFLVVKVKDTGIGIAKEKQGMLFQRFQQAMERTLAREAGGTGLGLYISREFARLMGGDLLLLESELDKGSTFAVKMPLVKQIK